MPQKLQLQDWSKEQLVDEVARLRKRKKYGLVWEDKPEDVVEQCKTELPVLKEVKNKAITKDKNGPVNILIEGDNYHALSVLNYTHKGKVDVIYIDPPYNTGNKDFKYNDHWVDKEDTYRHSKWLSFLQKRLELAKKLLSNSGVLFVSIDDNEFHNLRLLLNEIFGEKNIEIMIWRKSGDGRYGKMKNTLTFRNDHEYILAAYKGKGRLNKIKIYPNFLSTPKKDDKGREFWSGYIARGARGSSKGHRNYYSVKAPNGKTFSAQFELSKPEFLELDKAGGIYWTGTGIPYRKIYRDEYRQIVCPSVLLDVGGTYEGKMDINNIFGFSETKDAPFDNPKPVNLLKRLLDLSTKENAVVLDFMAGSGTTGQAVLEFNAERGGNRSFVLCTNNENKIAEEVCYPRVTKVIKGYKNSKGEAVAGLGGNLKYFRTAFVKAEPNDKNKEALTRQATEMLCMREDTFEAVKDTKNTKIFKNAKQHTGIVFDENAIPAFKKDIAKIGGVWSLYIFSLGDDTYEDEFEDMKQKITVAPIPEAILRVYRRLFKP